MSLSATGTSSSSPAGAVVLITAAAVGIILIHGWGRPGSGLQAEEFLLRERLGSKPEFSGLSVKANRYDVTLSGWVHTASDRLAAAKVVKDSLPAGRSRFRDEVGVWTPAWLEVEKRGGTVLMRGELPAGCGLREAQEQWKLPDVTVERGEWMWYHRGVKEPPWGRNLGSFVELFVRRASEGRLWAQGTEVVVEGRFARSVWRDEVLAAAHRIWDTAGGEGIRLVDRTRVHSEPVATETAKPLPVRGLKAAQPFWLELGHSGPEIEVRGAVADEAQRQELLALLGRGERKLQEELIIGVPTVAAPPWWPSLVKLIELFVRESEEGSIQVAGEMIQISGRMKATGRKEDFLATTKRLTGLPEFELRLTWPDKERQGLPRAVTPRRNR